MLYRDWIPWWILYYHFAPVLYPVHRKNKYDNIIFIDACHEELCIFPFLFRKKILASKTVTWDTSPLRLRKGTKYIFITIASASSIKKISLSNSDTTLLLEKNYTAKQNPSNTFLPSKSAKTLSSFFILSPLLLETSRFSHLTRTLFDSITVRNHHPRFLHADDRKTGCGEMLVLVVENSLSSGLCAREQA